MDYETFIQNKSQLLNSFGFKPTYIPDYLFDFQKFLCDWAINKGRSAIFADTGLGKTPMQLVWSQNIVEHTNKSVLILTPLAVSAQTLREAEKFGMAAYKSREGEMNHGTAIYVTNYERLHYFDYNNFSGVVCDESSILKNFKGAIKQAVTIFMRKLPYRLLATATASPNDFIELGTSSEALGYLGFVDMLSKFFKNTQNTASYGGGRYHGKESKWRFKGYSETPFWKWVVSWARAIRKPSDIDFDDDGYILPKLIEKQHVIKARNPRQGELFDIPAITLQEQREERRITDRKSVV